MHYEERAAHFEVAGDYEAWIYGYCDPIPGPSAAAWRVRSILGGGKEDTLVDVVSSDRNVSDNYRATVGAARRAVEALPPQSTIKIFSDVLPVVDGLNCDAKKWQAQNWRKKGSTERRNGWEIWRIF